MSLASICLMFCLPFMVSYHKLPEAAFYGQVVAFTLGILSLIAFFKPLKTGLKFPPHDIGPHRAYFIIGRTMVFGDRCFLARNNTRRFISKLGNHAYADGDAS